MDNPPPTQPPVDETVPAPRRTFVDVSQANVLLSYDPETGDITITGQGINVNALELISQQGIFLPDGGGEQQLFDVTVPHKIFRLRIGNGVNVIELPAVAQTGLSASQFATDVTFSGVMQDRITMNLGFAMARSDTIAVGDANADYYFNEADVLAMMKSGSFGNGGTAVWQTGDWTDDFRFDQNDIDLLTQLEYYGAGPYSDLASSSRAERTEISAGNHGDVLLYYDPANGDLSVLASSAKLTALNLVSSNQQFRTQAVQHPLDVSTSQTLFRLSLDPTDTWTFPGLLPPNLAFADVVADVQIDAAFAIGAGEFVATLTDSPEIPDFAIGDANRDLYVDEADLIYAFQSGKFGTSESAEWHEGDFDGDGRFDDADLSLWQESSSYSPEGSSYRPTSFLPQHTRTRLQLANSDLRIVYLKSTGSTAVLTENALSALQLHSKSGHIVSATEATGPFDVRSPTNYFAFAPDGIDNNRILLQLTPGLGRDALLRDLTVAGALADGAPLGPVSLVVIEPVPSELQCREIVAAGAVIGDANLDGRFDSSDLIWVFQDGEYEDDIPDNSDWYSGDWNCDGDFDAKDIVAAFQNGGFSFEARADIAMSVISHLADMQQERMQLKPRYSKLPLSNGEWQP
ncbi:MAG: hypothetical protein R3C28_15170 [Pirellulaceae bacterium]